MTSRRPRSSWSSQSISNWERTTSSPVFVARLQLCPPPLHPRHRLLWMVTDSWLWLQHNTRTPEEPHVSVYTQVCVCVCMYSLKSTPLLWDVFAVTVAAHGPYHKQPIFFFFFLNILFFIYFADLSVFKELFNFLYGFVADIQPLHRTYGSVYI